MLWRSFIGVPEESLLCECRGTSAPSCCVGVVEHLVSGCRGKSAVVWVGKKQTVWMQTEICLLGLCECLLSE